MFLQLVQPCTLTLEVEDDQAAVFVHSFPSVNKQVEMDIVMASKSVYIVYIDPKISYQQTISLFPPFLLST